MTQKQVIETLKEFQRWRRDDMHVGCQVRLRTDGKLHTITRIEEYDYRQPYQIDNVVWIAAEDIQQPDPFIVGVALDAAIDYLERGINNNEI